MGSKISSRQLKRCSYHRFSDATDLHTNGSLWQYYGQMAADTTIQRLDAIPATKRKSIFMGANSF